MDDLISRQAALKICRKYWHPTFNPIMEEIEKLPSAQSEIIRCKDCRYHIPQDERCRLWCQYVDPSEWCSRAKRKEGEA